MSSPAVQNPSSPVIRAALRRRGFTFVELIVVTAILAVLAGLVLYKAGDTTSEARLQITRTTAAVVRDAICGTQDAPGFLNDLREVPIRIRDLFDQPLQLPSTAPVPPYDPVTRRGWRGPYLLRDTGRYRIAPGSGFTSVYGNDGDPGVVDCWNHPIVLQWPIVPGFSLDILQQYTRLVSAGPDGVLNTPSNLLGPDINNAAEVGDDVVVYLFRMNGRP